MGWKPLFPEGMTPRQRTNFLALHCDDTLRAAGSLKDMTADWAFFTIGCLYTWGGFDHNIIAEYTQTHPDHDCSVMTLRNQKPIFSNMCPIGTFEVFKRFECELCAIPLEYWDGLRDRIAEISMVDRRKGTFAQVTIQELEIVDFLAVQRAVTAANQIPTLTITAFGLDGNKQHVSFVSRTTGPHDRAIVVKMPVREQTVRVAQAILAGDHRPLVAALEPKPADPADVARKIQEAKEKDHE
jgi:hypothetical protein